MRFFRSQTAAAVGVMLLAVSVPARKLGGSSTSSAGSVVPTGNMSVGRSGHTATLLRNGKVLIAGGMVRNGEFLADCELYDPGTRKFTTLGRMSSRRVSHTATLLSNGKVLIAGGIEGRFMSGGHWTGRTLASAELFDSARYDPGTGSFIVAAGSLEAPWHFSTATLLRSGKVLIVGGYANSDAGTARAWVYSP